jgi:adenylosuccinate synthase
MMTTYDVLIDGQFGSTGKGLLAGWLARKHKYDLCIANAAPNAGHTFIDEKGGKIVTHHLPISGVVNPDAILFLGPASLIDISLLEHEIHEAYLRGYDVYDRLYIHPKATVLTDLHKERETNPGSGPAKIASTGKGVGAALADKVMRKASIIEETTTEFNLAELSRFHFSRHALIEVPQGLHLGLLSGFYPHTTSREISVSQALADCQLHPDQLGTVYMTQRTFPIRVGNTENGDSGPFFPDSDELTWEGIGVKPGYTTVTGRMSRVETFSDYQYRDALVKLRPHFVFTNFMNYLTHGQKASFAARLRALEEDVRIHPDHIWGHGPAIDNVSRSVFG